jgi:hypothetical protein
MSDELDVLVKAAKNLLSKICENKEMHNNCWGDFDLSLNISDVEGLSEALAPFNENKEKEPVPYVDWRSVAF